LDYSKGVIGYAIYLEQRNGGTTQQQLFTPPFFHEESGEIATSLLISRSVSADNPRRKWGYKLITNEGLIPDVTNSRIFPAGNVDEAFEQVKDGAIKLFKRHLANAARSDWTYTGAPVVAEVTEADGDDIHMFQVPEALMRRVEQRARLDAGYPKDKWD
jgi:hypothetical protein